MSGENIQIKHSVASLKILPEDSYVNEDSSYGNITKEAVARGGIIYPQKKVIHCLAVTEDETANITGNPSSWSATIDSVAAGQNIDNLPALNNDNKSLFIISAGNYDTNEIDYPEANKNTPIQSPAQSWNALTVGAYTNIVTNESQSSTAKRGELSPYSTTSLAWSKTQWAVKPDVVFEGGNKVIDGDRCYQTEDTSVLTIDATYTDRIFNTMAGTSPATAQAAHFAASIATEYPNMLPETIRALMIHSAKWTDEMEEQFLSSRNKGDYVNILRTCGYGVPQLEDALYSARNSLVLIAENEIQPYRQKSDNKGTETNEMHLYELPWPQAELLALGNTDVELKVTLSYFIEPAPFSMGNITSNKYRYASHGLRFDLNRVGESKDVFVQSINKIDKDAAKANGEAVTGRPTSEWKYSDACGINNGSVHSNIWKGTAADLATSNILAVYPVMGWWKDRPALGCYNKKARYSLIVSIKTPPVETDIYTPIANLVNVSTPVPIQVQG